jgi:hypothetical protein
MARGPEASIAFRRWAWKAGSKTQLHDDGYNNGGVMVMVMVMVTVTVVVMVMVMVMVKVSFYSILTTGVPGTAS